MRSRPLCYGRSEVLGRHTASKIPLLARLRRRREDAAPTTSDVPEGPSERADLSLQLELDLASRPAETDLTIRREVERPPLRLVPGRAERALVDSGAGVRLCYPDGRIVPIDWSFAGQIGRHRRRYVADVPPEARLSTGMLIRAGAVVVPVALDPVTDDWIIGGGAR